MLSKLTELQKTSNSLEILRKVNKTIPERNFHEFTYILHNLRTLLVDEEKLILKLEAMLEVLLN